MLVTDRQTDRQTGYPSIDRPWLKYYSEKDLAIISPKCTVFDNVIHNNQMHLSAPALYYFGKKYTYKDLFESVDRVRDSFLSMGVRKGDNVAFLILTCPEMVYAILALNSIGAVANMINPTFSAEQMRDRINDTGADIIIILDQLYDRLAPVINEICPKSRVIVEIENSMPVHIKLIAHRKLKKNIPYGGTVIRWKSFLSMHTDVKEDIIEDRDENLPAIMVYSSGTTGASKGIVLTNHGINHTIAYYDKEEYVISQGDVFLHMGAPWLSTLMVICLLMPLKKGIAVAIEPVFSEESFVKGIKKYKPTMILSTVSHWLYAVDALNDTNIDLSNMRYPITGGEKVLADTEVKINQFLKEHKSPSALLTGYGMCELGSTATATSIEHHKYGSAGYPIKDVIVAAFNVDTNEECKYYERGEIRVLTPARMKAYYNRPDATAEFFWKDSEEREWGCTGDVGYVDEDGFVFVEGRANDCFISTDGEKVYNFDIENVILEVPEVLQCEVVGRSAANGAEEPIAFVMLESEFDIDVTISKINNYCSEKLESNAVPVAIRVLEKFPVKPSGKRDIELLKMMAQEEK